MAASTNPEQQPLLPGLVGARKNGSFGDIDSESPNNNVLSRDVEDDVLPEASPMGRNITWQSAYIIVMSRVIGSGIFATPGAILRSVGSPGLSLLIWIAGAVISACGLAVLLEYGCMLPRSGGQKVYLEFTYRHPRFLASTLVAINAVLLGLTASNCVIFSQYILFAFEADSVSDTVRKIVGAGLLTLATIIHAVTPRLGVRIQNVLGWSKIGIVAFMVLSGIYVVILRLAIGDDMGPRSSVSLQGWDHLWQGSIWNWGAIATALFKVFYSYAGLDNLSNVLNEVKDPVRTLRSVTLTALFTTCAIFLLVNVAYFLVVPIDEIRESGELVAALFFERVFGGNFGRRFLPLVVALSAVGNVLVVVFAMARLKQEIARQGLLPFSERLSSTMPFNSPLGGLLLTYVPSLLVIVLSPSQEVFSFILETEGYSGQILGLLTGAGLIWLRIKRPDLKRPFKAWTSAVLFRFLLGLALLAAPFFPPSKQPAGGLYYATYAIVGVAIFVGSLLYWYVWTILLPRIRGYTLEEETVVLQDGTAVTRIIHKERSS
ncbi:low-affinity methionine permease [Purpureocillium takamizusanense]|uniref:Low-affinity methionine permease n=1 Tax=Purpureocillium takamizusanense TaxID=2060973 RepID=A0A9Q8QF20_9HYPO|nr:low-affinity methionine permease [Purpureocillium takamizusanense]UNI18460.1 low-affinity methionine permease [Purpureocillium takamizusanense]